MEIGPQLSQFVVLPPLNNAVTLAGFHKLGRRLSSFWITGAITSEASFNNLALILSRPIALFGFNCQIQTKQIALKHYANRIVH